MSSSALIALAIAAAAWGAQFVLGSRAFGEAAASRQRVFDRIWIAAAALLFATAVLWTVLQYRLWQADPFAAFFLPPHRTWTYFAGYAGARFLAPFFAAFITALAGEALARYLNRRHGERFFEAEEPRMFGAGILLAGYPGFLIYIPLVLLSGVFFSLVYHVLKKGRAPLYFLWFPAAILAILIVQFLPDALIGKFNF